MKTIKFLSAFAALLAPLAAQADDAVAAKADKQVIASKPAPSADESTEPTLGFEVRTYPGTLAMHVSHDAAAGFEGFAMIVANCTGGMVKIDGLPLLLEPHAVLAVAPFADRLDVKLPFGGLPCDLYLQAGALLEGQILVSPIRMVAGPDSADRS